MAVDLKRNCVRARNLRIISARFYPAQPRDFARYDAVPRRNPRYIVHGSRGSYVRKYGLDPREERLKNGGVYRRKTGDTTCVTACDYG